jgi:hypothetical protein
MGDPGLDFQTWEGTTSNQPLITEHENGCPILESLSDSRVGKHEPEAL